MTRKVDYINVLLLIPSFLECLDVELFLISIPGFPLSLGRLTFLLSGIVSLLNQGIIIWSTKIVYSLVLIYLGLSLSTIVSGGNFLSVIGVVLLLIGSIGNARLFLNRTFQKILSLFFLVLWTYWTLKMVLITSFGSIEYGSGDFVNHHIPGMMVSVSAAFISAYFFMKRKKLSLIGIIILLTTAVICLLIESRSNFVFTIVSLVYLITLYRKLTASDAIRTIPTVILAYMILINFISSQDRLQQRFTLSDVEYQEQTTEGRLEFISIGTKQFFSNPLFGRGIGNGFVEYNGIEVLVHNQYLTFILSGGIFSLIGVVLFLRQIGKISIRLRVIAFRYGNGSMKGLIAMIASCLVFFMTLVTIENGGMLFYLMVSILISSFLQVMSSEWVIKKIEQ